MGGAARRDLEFRYSETERQALAEAVPDPHWPDELDGWDKLVTLAHYEGFRSDKPGFIARELEHAARECLDEEERLRPAKEDADHVRAIGRTARKLRKQLLKPTPYRGSNFARVFFGLDRRLTEGEQGRVAVTYQHEILLDLLDEMARNEAWVSEILASWHNENTFAGRHHPGFARFVDAAITFWQVWTLTAAGAAKKEQGGPATRFLCAAANPVLDFAGRRGLILRRGGLLTLEAAGQLIEEIRRIDPSPDCE